MKGNKRGAHPEPPTPEVLELMQMRYVLGQRACVEVLRLLETGTLSNEQIIERVSGMINWKEAAKRRRKLRGGCQ